MSIRKSRSKDIPNNYFVSGREQIFLDCLLPSGQEMKISIQLGSVDVNKKEYAVIDATFDKNATVEFSHDIPQNARIVVRMPQRTKGDS